MSVSLVLGCAAVPAPTPLPTPAATRAAIATGASGSLPPGPCGRTSTPRAVRHVIWIFMENHGYKQIVGSPSAPYVNELIAQCGLAANYDGIAHPSLPNYIAATSGDTHGVTDDADPEAHPLAVPTIYSQVTDAGLTWREYEEDAPGNCPLTSRDPYAVKHDPAAYYTSIRANCQAWDVPMGTIAAGNFVTDLDANALPAFAFVTPNQCADTHDCGIATGDQWLSEWIAKIVASPGYAEGSTVLFITWDEDEGKGTESNHVPTIVVSPSTPIGSVSSTTFDHYSLLRTTEEILGLPTFLGHAAEAASMRAAFDL